MIPVEGHKNLFRDEKTGAIIVDDVIGYSKYLSIKNKRQQEKEELDQIRKDIEEIKSLLKEIVNGTR